jgi:fermentation-respiration switch protein FrsA (DUF1100 family)
MAFYVSQKRPPSDDVLDLPQGNIYAPYWDYMVSCAREVRAMPCEELWIHSHDGLKLHGRYFEYAPGAPIELMFHGYRGSAERDLSGGVRRCFQLGHSVLLVDQRCSGKSEGTVITFGVHEHNDCLLWIDKILDRFGSNVKIILTGISMGATTVLIAAGHPLPKNVIGVLADCGYTSAKEIIKVVIKQMHLPPTLAYPFVKLGARLYGHFHLKEISATEALKNCRVPVLFFHGEDDAFVPCEMSRINYKACASTKKLVTIPGAGHGLSYPVDKDRYLDAMRDFFDA